MGRRGRVLAVADMGAATGLAGAVVVPRIGVNHEDPVRVSLMAVKL